MVKAIYQQREDGDYDFVAAFEGEQYGRETVEWVAQLSDYLIELGETVLVRDFDDVAHIVDVLSADADCQCQGCKLARDGVKVQWWR